MNQAPGSVFSKPKFAPAPAGYVAGLGRGAVGFTTRSDIGPMKMGGETGPTPDAAPRTQYGPGPAPTGGGGPEEEKDRGDYSDAKFDKWNGFESGLLAGGEYDEEDREADDTYALVDNYMDTRRKKWRDAKLIVDLEKIRKEKRSFSQQFSDIRKSLAEMTTEDWMKIPETGDYGIKRAKRAEKFTPVPDSVIDSTRRAGEMGNMIEAQGDGRSEITAPGSRITDIGEARGKVVSIKLDKVSESVLGQTSVDPVGYLTQINNLTRSQDFNVADLKKARRLMKNLISSDPKNVAAWIAAARLEDYDGKLQAARNIIAQGLQQCIDSDDLWLEAVRLEPPEKSKEILSQAVVANQHSVKLWLAAASKETDQRMKCKILSKALEHIPNSVKLWKELIEQEEPEAAKVILYRAVKCVPTSMELWLALAKLENYENAKVILNRAREYLLTEPQIRLHAAKLEESQGNVATVEKIVERAIKALAKENVALKREDWLNEAESCERSGSLLTGRSIIKFTIALGLEDNEEKEKAWLDDVESLVARQAIETARAVYEVIVSTFPEKKHLWTKFIEFERLHGTKENMQGLLIRARDTCKDSEVFWLIEAKAKWKQGDIEGARQVLAEAFTFYPSNENLYLATAKLEKQNGNAGEARKILAEGRAKCPTARIWMQSVQLEREQQNTEEALTLCKEAVKLHPGFPKLWMILGQMYAQKGEIKQAEAAFDQGLDKNPQSVSLWVCAMNLQIQQGVFAKARSIYEKARVKNPSNPELWYNAIMLEVKANNAQGARYILSNALKECPKSGELWALAIELETRAQRKARSLEALKQLENDPHVLVAVSKLFWKERKTEKARRWLESAVSLNPDYGDAWAYYYRFEQEFGTEAAKAEVRRKCKEAEPHHGRLWVSVSKKPQNWNLSTEEILELTVPVVEDILKKLD